MYEFRNFSKTYNNILVNESYPLNAYPRIRIITFCVT